MACIYCRYPLQRFPAGFADLFMALLAPLALALVGINFRGAAFVFRHFGRYKGTELPATQKVFTIASILTPFFMGMAVSATGAGRIRIINGIMQVEGWSAWIHPFTLTGGLIGVAICAYITPFYMTVRTTGALQEDFRRRAFVGSVLLGVLTTIEIPIAWFDARAFFDALVRPAPLAIVGLAVASGISTMVLLWKRRYLFAQVMADVTIALTVSGFAAALYPYMLMGQLTFAQASAPASTLRVLIATLPIGAAILVPSLWFLYRTFARPITPGNGY